MKNKTLYSVYRRSTDGLNYLIASFYTIQCALYCLEEYQAKYGRFFVYMKREEVYL